ncbi:protein meaA [Rhodospirillum rubrum]|uniref:Methylmalonyl-CoA mutase n=1 Tax=Rhodospirillum rubrum (strain ATCC 11170 / ATH 1.1.1 / DSM 467 / LMG 4362 / NCIMB 8255 / S1) TaxID=269796 RepID=Q2RPT8_RHORT|nr:protein meaA [Rhodospirillum rubrum]ABC23857.1 methylmalonyl-CoA mutase [Rhodospirillum rubrum ATCC 11170]AEO49599.1 methylmalonyl-CoA mutase, large subunit [Rhodospirillum rubrum F11]MBK5955534.1 methylmalonyl-CoA mutase [Rhodospirillum rubrum]QXG79804.1 protein meaA [Rhodospirillum rubrum]HAP99742.1 methylmalonyl-CoA mutase [Rhodospirillum rubrum]
MSGDAASTPKPKLQTRDKPWLFRTYSGHSSARASNALYRTNLARGQTGLSVAFDLPTQTGYDSDHVLARGEVGKVGVPISHLGDMQTLFEGIPLEKMNTSMTINAPAPWLLALYVATAERQGADRAALQGTVQNDLIKEYLSRGTYIFPPEPSLRLIGDVIAFTYREIPKWNPTNVCSYHLQEAGATPEQELAFALATAIAVLDTVKAGGQVPEADFPEVVGRISFFVNAGIRFITEMCKMRAFCDLWDEICLTRYGVTDEKFRRFRYGVQVNSLGLTEQQPENNVYRILLEMLAVVLSKNARARAVQLPAWNEALGLPRPWDQQWSLRLQQIVAFETDLLDYGDIFDGSREIAAKVEELKTAARDELARIAAMGGAEAAVEAGYMKQKLVESNSRRIGGIESGEQIVVGVNKYTEGADSPLVGGDGAIMTVDPAVEAEQIAALTAWKAARDAKDVGAALDGLRRAAAEGTNIMEPTIACAHAGVTTGEWSQTLREVFGEYRAPTGVGRAAAQPEAGGRLAEVRLRVDDLSTRLGRRLKILVGKPGLDGHSNGAEQIAVRARDSGMEVVYEGIRLTPAQIVNAALEESVHVVGLSILSGSHVPLVSDVLDRMRAEGLADIPVIVGGIIPPEDEKILLAAGVARVYTPKDYDITAIMADIVGIVDLTTRQAA